VIKEAEDRVASLNKDLRRYVVALQGFEEDLAKKRKQLATAVDQKCPTCGHHLDDEKHKHIEGDLASAVEELEAKIAAQKEGKARVEEEIASIVVERRPSTFYEDIEEAYNHRSSLDNLQASLEREMAQQNPFLEQATQMEETGLQEVSFENINELTVLRDHQEFLLKLLTSKDSFIRRKIIDQNLSYLNHRLEHYLEKIGLPHEVRFQSDLNVEIQEHGRDLDFDNLSRGERTRLILSLSWAFRDVYESLNTPISLLFIDELIDSGLDTSGVESSLSVLKKMARDGNRNIFLISHRDELIGRVSSVLRVIKEGGFTSFDEEADIAV
jgi:DNA repair exonuclease SbcCD ATPase subunit